MCSKIVLYSMLGEPGFCLIFILSENNIIQSATLLEMPISFPSMENFLSRYSEIKKFKTSKD